MLLPRKMVLSHSLQDFQDNDNNKSISYYGTEGVNLKWNGLIILESGTIQSASTVESGGNERQTSFNFKRRENNMKSCLGWHF
jgi:hypothetical protein